jgi:hypothetical protein
MTGRSRQEFSLRERGAWWEPCGKRLPKVAPEDAGGNVRAEGHVTAKSAGRAKPGPYV